MENRQDFIQKIASGKLRAVIVNREKYVRNYYKNSFVHHVLFWLKEPENLKARKQFESGLQNLIKVPQIQSCHIGTSVKSSREVVDYSFTYSYIAFFESKEDQNTYQTHPIHLQFIEDCQHLWEKVIVYDAM